MSNDLGYAGAYQAAEKAFTAGGAVTLAAVFILLVMTLCIKMWYGAIISLVLLLIGFCVIASIYFPRPFRSTNWRNWYGKLPRSAYFVFGLLFFVFALFEALWILVKGIVGIVREVPDFWRYTLVPTTQRIWSYLFDAL